MAEGTRPGGLTALAVLNFVFGGLGAISVLGLLALFGFANAVTDGGAGEVMAEGIGLNGGMLMLTLALGVAGSALLIISGVGYIQQKRVLGRTIGNLYGILALLGTVIGIVDGQPFGFASIIGLIYPVLTLIMVNTTFKEDLVN